MPVELLLKVSASAIRANSVEYKRKDQLETLPAATIIWTGGNTTHPLIKNLSIPKEQRDRAERVWVTPTLQLPEFPEVFAGGDCVVVGNNPLPATAQVAYQQGAAIARNLKAIAEGNAPKPAHVTLRGTLMKLGLGESVANLADRFQITGRLGHLIRKGTYLELLPTPVHNFQVTTEWLTDDIFHSYSNSASGQKQRSRVLQWTGGAAAAMVLVSSSLLIWWATQPGQFNRVWQPTGLPNLVERLLPDQKQPQN